MNKHILIVDDEEEIGFVLKNYLEKKAFEVRIISKLNQWDDIFQFGRPDLIFLDYRMSPVTGKDILERLQFEPDPIPVIMMSAYKSDSGALEVEKMGARAYISKPFNFSEIEQLIHSIIK